MGRRLAAPRTLALTPYVARHISPLGLPPVMLITGAQPVMERISGARHAADDATALGVKQAGRHWTSSLGTLKITSRLTG